MKALKICDVGLHPDTSHAFHSMLKVVAGRSKADWSIGGVADADVMIASSGGDPASFAAWGASGKPFVLVVDDRGSWPPTPFVLRHPFRVMQLLSILDDVAEQFHGRSTSTPADSVAWSAAEALRLCMSRMGVGEWQVARGDLGEELWLGGGSAHADPATLARLRECANWISASALSGRCATDPAPLRLHSRSAISPGSSAFTARPSWRRGWTGTRPTACAVGPTLADLE